VGAGPGRLLPKAGPEQALLAAASQTRCCDRRSPACVTAALRRLALGLAWMRQLCPLARQSLRLPADGLVDHKSDPNANPWNPSMALHSRGCLLPSWSSL